MSLFNVFNVTGSAMSAESVRLNTTSSNLANADSISSSAKDTYSMAPADKPSAKIRYFVRSRFVTKTINSASQTSYWLFKNDFS